MVLYSDRGLIVKGKVSKISCGRMHERPQMVASMNGPCTKRSPLPPHGSQRGRGYVLCWNFGTIYGG